MRFAQTLRLAARLVDALLVAFVAIVLACSALTVIGPRLGHQPIVIRGGSMEPTIPLGSLLILDRVAPADLRVGDTVSFEAANSTTVTHRVTRLVELGGVAYFGTKGDANASEDPMITPVSAIIGRSQVVIPWAGYIVTLLGTPLGALAAFLVAATLFVFAVLLDTLALERRRVVQPGLRPSEPLRST